MRLDELGPAAAEALPPGSARLPSDLERLRSECRRQALQIDLLTEAVSTLRRGAKALKAENVELRAHNAGLRAAAHESERLNGAELADVTIPLTARAPGLARTVVAGCLGEHVTSSVLDEAQLLVTELATNSLIHSGTSEGDDLVVRVHLWHGTCRLEVEDRGCDGVIAPRSPDPIGGGGMGLNLVQTLALRWGVIRGPGGPTRVWAQLPCIQHVT
jgi:anti-sigma regulatory factor (Ser/Thr protein kinase)